MLKIITLTVFLFFILFLPGNILAHTLGQPPFFKVNGVLTDFYPVPTSSNPDFKLPQDIAPQVYLINENINFEIDGSLLPMPKEIINKTTFSWDFGDGEKAEGLKNIHSYKKQGSYILEIRAKYNEDIIGDSQLIQSMQINIVPSKAYKLPKAILKINGWQSKDPLTDPLNSKFTKEFEFDATSSESESPVSEYIWDFGDGEIGRGKKVTHRYTTNPYTVFPVLRMGTEDGYISDTFAQIVDDDSYSSVSAAKSLPKGNLYIYGYLVLLILGVGASAFIIWKKTKKKSKKLL
jgi:hypothetical protein